MYQNPHRNYLMANRFTNIDIPVITIKNYQDHLNDSLILQVKSFSLLKVLLMMDACVVI